MCVLLCVCVCCCVSSVKCSSDLKKYTNKERCLNPVSDSLPRSHHQQRLGKKCINIKLLELNTSSIFSSVCRQAVPWQEYPSWAADDLVDLPVKGRFVGPVVVVDGYVLEAPPFEVWEQKGDYSDVPFVIGSTEQEEDFR